MAPPRKERQRTPADDKPNYAAALLAGTLAWVIPGAGHMYLGRAVRGIILCICINGLFWAGVAFGGVFTVEPLRERWWFAAQVGAGASGLAAWFRQKQFRQALTHEAGLPPMPPPSLAGAQHWWERYDEALAEKNLALRFPTDSVARSYSGIAGMLNLLCIFDAIMLGLLGHFGEPPPEEKPRKEPPA